MGHITSPRTGERKLIAKVSEKASFKCQYCRRNRLDIHVTAKNKKKEAKKGRDAVSSRLWVYM
jgi:hypothetical protein